MSQVVTTSGPAGGPEPAKPRRIALVLTVLILVLLTALLFWRGMSYYRLSLDARVDHQDFRTLSPSGFLGHGYGIVGTALILTNLLYLVRRRFARYIPDSFGTMKTWLNIHVFTGLVGSLLVVFHSAFQLRTPIATLTSVSLGIVVLTGLIGLYLYALVPKAGLKPLKDRLAEIQPLLPGVAKRVEEFVKTAPVTRLPADASIFRAVVTMPRWILEARQRRRGMGEAVRGDKLARVVEVKDPKFVRALIEELGQLAASEVDTHAGGAVMRSWRSIHRFLALLMVLSVSVHIGVAWYYGFRWIF